MTHDHERSLMERAQVWKLACLETLWHTRLHAAEHLELLGDHVHAANAAWLRCATEFRYHDVPTDDAALTLGAQMASNDARFERVMHDRSKCDGGCMHCREAALLTAALEVHYSLEV